MDARDQPSAGARSTDSELPIVHHGRLLTRKDKIREAPHNISESLTRTRKQSLHREELGHSFHIHAHTILDAPV